MNENTDVFPDLIKYRIASLVDFSTIASLARLNKAWKKETDKLLNDLSLIPVYVCAQLFIDNTDKTAFDSKFFRISAELIARKFKSDNKDIKLITINFKKALSYIQAKNINWGIYQLLIPKKYLQLLADKTFWISSYEIKSVNIKGVYNKLGFSWDMRSKNDFADCFIVNTSFNEENIKKDDAAANSINTRSELALVDNSAANKEKRSSCTIS